MRASFPRHSKNVNFPALCTSMMHTTIGQRELAPENKEHARSLVLRKNVCATPKDERHECMYYTFRCI